MVAETVRGKASTRLGQMDLNCMVMQDDITRMNDTLEGTREGCTLISNTLKRKQYQSGNTSPTIQQRELDRAE